MDKGSKEELEMSAFKKTVYINEKKLGELLGLTDDQRVMEMELQFDEGEWVIVADIFDCSDEPIENLPF
jgi:hypothetical protein